jgi:hypothetical protein
MKPLGFGQSVPNQLDLGLRCGHAALRLLLGRVEHIDRLVELGRYTAR